MGSRERKDILFEQFARVGKALSSPKRLELLDLLAQGERTVEALARAAMLGVTTCSAHLQTLRQANLVATRRDGTKVYYRLAGTDVGIGVAQVDQLAPFARIGVRQKPLQRHVHERRIAIEFGEVFVGKAFGLDHRRQSIGRARAHLAQIVAFERLERLGQHDALAPHVAHVHVVAAIGRVDAGLDRDFESGQILTRHEAAVRRVEVGDHAGDGPAVEEVVRRPELAVAILEAIFAYRAAPAMGEVKVPIHAINADMTPTSLEVNRKYAPQFDVVIIKGTGHYPMLEDPARFNQMLAEILRNLAKNN